MNEKSPLVDVVLKDGKFMKQVQHPDGRIDYEPLKEINDDPFEGTETVPDDWTPPDTEILIASETPVKSTGLTRDEHCERSCRIEAVLIKYLSPSTGGPFTESIDTKGDAKLKSLLQDLCHAFGGRYENIKIK